MGMIVKQDSEEVIFSGASDDLIHVTSTSISEEFNAYASGRYVGFFSIIGNGEAAKVHVIYDGDWAFAYAIYAEGEPIPSWPLRHEITDSLYCTSLVLTLPKKTAIVWEPYEK